MIKKFLFIFVLFFLFQFQVTAQEGEKVFLPIITKAGHGMSTNNWNYIKPKDSSNRVLNPSAEATGNFSAVSGATVTRVTTYQKYGLYSYRIESTASGDGAQLTLQSLANSVHYATARIRGPHPNIQFSIGGNAKNVVLIKKVDDNWNLYGALFSASETSGQTTLQILALDSGDFNVDGVQVEPLNYWTTYIDGTQDGCEWLGVPHESVSQRSGESRAGGISQDFFEEYGLQIRKIINAGATGRNISIDQYAISPGGELNNIKVQSRTFTIIGKFIADSESELLEKKQELLTELSDTSYVNSQAFRIRFNGAKVQKEIQAHYQSGLESDLSAFYNKLSIEQDEWQRNIKWTENVAIQFSAPNPYWLEVGESAIELDTNDSATFRGVAARLRSTGQWDNLGPPNAAGTYTNTYALAEDDTYIYIGGDFINFDNIANADYIVRWHKVDQVYSALDTGMNGRIQALIVGSDGILYAGGAFTTAGGGAANRIASWNGSAWSALGTGMNSTVQALAFSLDGTLYAGGNFTTADGGAANYMASWNGSAWSALGSGMNSTVSDISIGLNDILYAGGSFTTAGGGAANYIASWDISTSTWSALSSGMNLPVGAVVVSLDGILYAGGAFTTAGGSTANYIASWNGNAWKNLSSGMNSDVNTLAIDNSGVLYAAGNFTTAGGISVADNMAIWNGYTWTHLDLSLPAFPVVVRKFMVSKYTDPVSSQKFDLWIGIGSSGTAIFGGLVTVDNEGTALAFPIIVYNRSGGTTAVLETLRNERTAKEILFDYSLLDGETLTIDLNPVDRTITSSQFGSRLDAKLPGSDFGSWALLPNDNDVTTYINESGTPTITAYMLWRDSYDGYN